MERNVYYDSTNERRSGGQGNSNHEQNGFVRSNEHNPGNNAAGSSGSYYGNGKYNVKDVSPSDEYSEISQFESSLYRQRSRKNKYFPHEQNTSYNEFPNNVDHRSNNAQRNENTGSTQPKKNPEIVLSDYVNFAVHNENQEAVVALINQFSQMNALDDQTLVPHQSIEDQRREQQQELEKQLSSIYSNRYPEINVLDFLNLHTKGKPQKRMEFTNFEKYSQMGTSESHSQNFAQLIIQEEQTLEESSGAVFSETSVFDCPSFYGQETDEEITPPVTSPKKEFELKSEDFPNLFDANKNVTRKKGEKKAKESSDKTENNSDKTENNSDKTENNSENTKKHAVNDDYGLKGFLELIDEQETNEGLKMLRSGVDLENFGIDVTVSDYLSEDFINLWADEDEDSCKNGN